jgi:CxxC motif-containing protein (DUF1111 family)
VIKRGWFVVVTAIAIGGPRDDGYEPGEEYAGDVAATSFDATRAALSRPVPALVGPRGDGFLVGKSTFNRSWVTAPSSTTGLDGLGPTFNARSCSTCHDHDGRGRPPEPGQPMLSALVRLSVPGSDAHGGPLAEPTYGSQLNPLSILGVPGEGAAVLTWDERAGSYADGTAYSLRRSRLSFTLAFGLMAANALTSVRVAPQNAGLGLLELVPEAEILAAADPDDANGDGISGRPNRVWDVAAATTRLGRFGWKASQPSLRQQSAAAFIGDIGITSSLYPAQNCSPAQTACLAALDGNSPPDGVELEDAKLDRVTFYAMTLAAPGRRRVHDPDVLRGKTLFKDLGCVGCHTPVLHTGPSAAFPELAGLTIRPYTDLLLHDMGDGLADGRPDYLADGREWRTAPLWGIGLSRVVNGHELYLHDGRARGLAEAILWHGGEANAARERFRALPVAQRNALLAFLGSL